MCILETYENVFQKLISLYWSLVREREKGIKSLLIFILLYLLFCIFFNLRDYYLLYNQFKYCILNKDFSFVKLQVIK